MIKFIKRFNKVVILFLGFFCLIFYQITRSNGFRKFYENAQRKNGLERSFLDNWMLNFLFNNYYYYKKNKDKEGISTVSEVYLEGKYGINQSSEILEQQRGLILSLLEKEIAKPDIKTILEIGTTNGDVIGYLGKKYKGKIFYGIDFSVHKVIKKNELDNTNFIKDYAFNFLSNNKITFDLVFFSSLFCESVPKELENYLNIFQKKGIKKIILSEPCWAGTKPVKDDNKFSIHLEHNTWFHNYYAYLANAGYDVDEYKFFHYINPGGHRQDIFINLVSASIRKI